MTAEVLVERITEEMHWFRAGGIDVEGISCIVGIPTDGEGEPYVACSFPGGPIAHPEVPPALRGAAREAREAVRADSTGRVRQLGVTYVATEQRVFLCDHAPTASGLWSSGRVTAGIRAGHAHLAADAGWSGGGEGLLGCSGRPIRSLVGDGFADRSMFSAAAMGEGPAVAVREAVLAGLPAATASLPPTPSGPTVRYTAPLGLVWTDAGNGRRPSPGGPEIAFEVPEGRTVGSRVTYTWVAPDGTASFGGASVTNGVPGSWLVVDGEPPPEGHTVRAVLEIFATDEPVAPEWTPEARGFERLLTASLAAR